MSGGVQIIIVLAILIFALLLYISFQVTQKLRNLTSARIDVYLTYFAAMRGALDELRNLSLSRPWVDIDDSKLDVIASLPVMQKSVSAKDALVVLFERRQRNISEGELLAEIECCERKLADLLVEMRADLALSIQPARYPNAEILNLFDSNT